MDKKRRDYETSEKLTSKQECKHFWASIMTPLSSCETCGLQHRKYEFLSTYGTGSFEFFSFDGLYVGITDVSLKKNINLSGIRAYETFELSFLMEGEQIITLDAQDEDLIYESQECYLLYISNNSGHVRYLKNKPFKEIKVRMDKNFIEKHRLDEVYELHKKHELHGVRKKISEPISAKTQEILTELLSDKRQGLLKRLFLESKVLELLSLQLDTNKRAKSDFLNKDPKSIKKIYEIQSIINSDLTEQFSIQQLSRKVGVNDFVVKKEFKRIFGETIFEYALTQRMTKAKQLLKHSKKPIYEISELVGYKNATHFTAAFKKVEGITPKKYRNASLAKIS